MAHRPGWETEFINKGFSLSTVSFLRNMAEVVQPGTISLDVTELESLQHEFRLLRNSFDQINERLQNLEVSVQKPEIQEQHEIFVNELMPVQVQDEYIQVRENTDYIDERLNELEALTWLTQ